MENTSNPATAARPPSWPMYRALVGVGVVCALLIVSVYVLTGPVIARNEAAALQRAVFLVLPGAVDRASFTLAPDGGFRPAAEGDDPRRIVHAGYDANGRLAGVAIEAGAMGYADVIRVLYGYAPQREAIVGMAVLASKETPGLGDKIEKDPSFLANFEALDVRLAADGTSPQNPIVAVKQGEKSQPWEIDGITGATISSKAVALILRRSSAQWVPVIYSHQGDLDRRGGVDGRQ